MSSEERIEREERAARLKQAREAAGFSGPKAVADALNINVNTYKAHEGGRNGFGVAAAHAYAELFGVSPVWLYMNIGPRHEAAIAGADQKERELIRLIADAPPPVRERIASFAAFEIGRYAELGRIDTATR